MNYSLFDGYNQTASDVELNSSSIFIFFKKVLFLWQKVNFLVNQVFPMDKIVDILKSFKFIKKQTHLKTIHVNKFIFDLILINSYLTVCLIQIPSRTCFAVLQWLMLTFRRVTHCDFPV